MKIKLIIDESVEEKIEIYSKERNELVRQIEELVDIYSHNLYGYIDDEIKLLSFNEIYRFYIENNKVFASTVEKKYLVKLRLYQIEEIVGSLFIKINQSCLINKKKVKRFISSWGGSLLVELTNNERDYISRRQTKIVMESMGVKNGKEKTF